MQPVTCVVDTVFSPNHLESQPLRVALEVILLLGSLTMLGLGGYYGGVTGLVLKIVGSFCCFVAFIRTTRLVWQSLSQETNQSRFDHNSVPQREIQQRNSSHPLSRPNVAPTQLPPQRFNTTGQEWMLYQLPPEIPIDESRGLKAIFNVGGSAVRACGIWLEKDNVPENMVGFRWITSRLPSIPTGVPTWYQDGFQRVPFDQKNIQWRLNPEGPCAYVRHDENGFFVYARSEEPISLDSEVYIDTIGKKYYFQLPPNRTVSDDLSTQESIILSGTGSLAQTLTFRPIVGIENSFLLEEPAK